MGRTGLAPGDPERLGGYRLAARLGAGGRGVVYEAYDEAGGRVAVKVLHDGMAADPVLRARFAGEVSAAQRVASCCTARLIAVEKDGPEPYIVSEYVDGPSLRDAVRTGGVLTGDRLTRLAAAIATALAAIHEAGVVHRDLKPDDVLLGPDGPRVVDFGIARTKVTSLIFPARVVGSPSYTAPEVLTAARVGPAADVFAWGAVVLFAATGRSPFEAGSVGAILHRVLTGEPSTDVLPEPLRSLVAAALDKDPEARPSSRDLLLGLPVRG
ncbi:serine/threonine-protein kinase [Planomonospora algeriensis]